MSPNYHRFKDTCYPNTLTIVNYSNVDCHAIRFVNLDQNNPILRLFFYAKMPNLTTQLSKESCMPVKLNRL